MNYPCLAFIIIHCLRNGLLVDVVVKLLRRRQQEQRRRHHSQLDTLHFLSFQTVCYITSSVCVCVILCTFCFRLLVGIIFCGNTNTIAIDQVCSLLSLFFRARSVDSAAFSHPQRLGHNFYVNYCKLDVRNAEQHPFKQCFRDSCNDLMIHATDLS